MSREREGGRVMSLPTQILVNVITVLTTVSALSIAITLILPESEPVDVDNVIGDNTLWSCNLDMSNCAPYEPQPGDTDPCITRAYQSIIPGTRACADTLRLEANKLRNDATHLDEIIRMHEHYEAGRVKKLSELEPSPVILTLPRGDIEL